MGLKSGDCCWDEIREAGELRKKNQISRHYPRSTAIVSLATPRLELGTPVGTDELTNCSYAGTAGLL